MKTLFSKNSGLRKFASDRDGTAAIELGLISPVLMLGLVATIDVGMAIEEHMNPRSGCAVFCRVCDERHHGRRRS